jgi:hypothetical protein
MGFARREQADAELFARGEFGACFLDRADAAARRAATAHQVGQVRERRARIAEMTDQRAEGARSDIVGPDQPQAVEPLGVGEVGGAGRTVVHAGAASPNQRLRSTCLSACRGAGLRRIGLSDPDALRKSMAAPQ